MIKTYEGFFDFFKRKKKDEVDKPKDNKRFTWDINIDKVKEIFDDSFVELVDIGYTVKTKYLDLETLHRSPYDNISPYVQITKHPRPITYVVARPARPGPGGRAYIDIPFKFSYVKDDVLSFCDRIKELGIEFGFAYVYENDKGGLSCDNPTYEDFNSGKYDDREVSILTIYLLGIEDTY